ncbi:alcohol dehydrogenase-like 7 isoform X2 [Actinidia eriantha]|uniref:alcohol dehydrogenase-like 7 isoform X2 n=1 Tax=Actinidia eriantha TaxID=165200 RepID=UPI00258C3393|nr:alcohol dehydrogenase-like 7 isoform X2 [Actinidia eriantha]
MESGKESPKTAGMPIRCRAAIGRGAGEPLVIEEVMVAPPKAHEVRIRILCTSLCHSDVTFWKMKPSFGLIIFLKDPPGYFPRIFGHESTGVVESTGEGVVELTEGDIVIPSYMADCGECADCKSKKSNLCSKLPFKVSPWMHRDETSRFTDLKGETIYHFLYVSSFSEYTVVDIAHLTKIDPAIPPNRACLLSCGVATVGARLCGASRIIGVDVNPDKFEIGQKFGVTDFVNPSSCKDKSLSEVINRMTGGGADYCFECVGLASLVYEAYACCRKGWGKIIVLGLDKLGTQLSFDSFEVLQSGKILTGSLFGGLNAKTDIPILAKRYMDKELQLDEFVTHEVSFEDINKAFDLLLEGQSLRCVIWMNK